MSTATPGAAKARRKSNLAFSFLSLNSEERAAMSVFYDFCRTVDDIADDPATSPASKTADLDAWRADIDAIAAGRQPSIALARELAPVVARFGVDCANLRDIIGGVALDTEPQSYANIGELLRYCYGVASAVGLVCIRIFGCTDPRCRDYAENLGYALQLTNILRDVVEDKRTYGRVYLPRDEMEAHGITPDNLANPDAHPACLPLFRLQAFRARHYFNKARRLLPEAERTHLKAALIMSACYEDILNKIAAHGFRFAGGNVKLSKPRLFQIAARVKRGMKHPLPRLAPPGRVAVFGAGVAGIATATQLAEQGFAVELYEAKSFPGGRACSLRDAPTGLTLDNGQHVIMGCYEAFLRLLHRLGTRDRLEESPRLAVSYIEPGGKISRLEAAALPAPFHLLAGIAKFGALNTADRIAILRLGTALRISPPPSPSETVSQWLTRHKQTPGSIRALWEPFCVAALNEPLATASARVLWETLRRSLFASPGGSAIFFARVGLSELFRLEAERFLRATGGSVHYGSPIESLRFEGDHVAEAKTSSRQSIVADNYISALPWMALRALLPADSKLREQISGLRSSGILNIHLLCDRPLFDAPFLGLLDSPFHWIFNRSERLPSERKGEYLYAVTMSAAGDTWMNKPSTEILTALRAELVRFFPAAKDAKFIRELVIKTKDATFAATPAAELLRPGPTTPWKNLHLAGDWLATSLPATLESAAISAESAVNAMDKLI